MLQDFIFTTAQAAQAAAPAADSTSNPLTSIVFFGALIAMMYFLMIRPQTKRAKEHRELLSHLNKGDEVVINGGLVGKIVNMGEQYLHVEIADNVVVVVQKNSIAMVLPKGTVKTI